MTLGPRSHFCTTMLVLLAAVSGFGAPAANAKVAENEKKPEFNCGDRCDPDAHVCLGDECMEKERSQDPGSLGEAPFGTCESCINVAIWQARETIRFKEWSFALVATASCFFLLLAGVLVRWAGRQSHFVWRMLGTVLLWSLAVGALSWGVRSWWIPSQSVVPDEVRAGCMQALAACQEDDPENSWETHKATRLALKDPAGWDSWYGLAGSWGLLGLLGGLLASVFIDVVRRRRVWIAED